MTTSISSKELTPAQAVANSVFGNLNELHIEAKLWETDYYNPTMDKLYHLLSKAFNEVLALRKSGSKTVKAFTEILKKKGIVCTARTSLELRVVRVVFGISDTTQRANRYASVLKIAGETKVTPDKFVEWIGENGGIDEIRRAVSTKLKPDYAEKAAEYFSSNTAVPSMSLTNADFKHLDDTDFRLLVVRKNSDDSFTPVSEVDSVVHINSALTYLGKNVVDSAEAASKQADADERLAQSVGAVANYCATDADMEAVVNG